MYDLTSFLTTVASSSAGIVAILGGFIASKLISIDGERDSILSRLRGIEKELSYHIAERDKLQKEDDATEALDFIKDHLDEMLSCDELEPIYQLEPGVQLSLERLMPYWEKGIEIGREYIQEIQLQKTRMNDVYIPDTLVQRYRGCYFEYELLHLIGEKVKRDSKKAENSRNSYYSFPPIDDLVAPARFYHASNDRYINEENHAISLLSMKKQLLEEQIPELKKPKGMKSGLVIFALFSVFCIIVPLGMSPFTTDNVLWYNWVKRIIMGLFVLGLVSIFSYLIYLLSWKNKGVMETETRSELQMKHYSVDTASKN